MNKQVTLKVNEGSLVHNLEQLWCQIPSYKNYFISSLKFMILLYIGLKLLGVIIGATLVKAGYDLGKVAYLGLPGGIQAFFEPSEPVMSYQLLSCIIRKNQDIRKYLSKRKMQGDKSGIDYFFHNIKGFSLYAFHFLLNVWKPYYRLFCFGKQRFNKLYFIILSGLSLFSFMVMAILTGVPFVPNSVFSHLFYGLNLPIAYLYIFFSIIPHSILEFLPSILVCAAIITLYLIAIDILKKNSSEDPEKINKAIFDNFQHFILSKWTFYFMVLGYLSIFIAGQIEANYSETIANFLFQRYLPHI